MCSWHRMESVGCVILAAGTWCEPRIVQRLIAQATSVLACDGALDACIAHGIHVTEVIGDLDSVSEAGLKAHIANGGDVHQFQSQESNDLEKALGLLEERKETACAVIGATGGDAQHEWANLMACGASGLDIICEAPEQTYRFFNPGGPYSIECEEGSVFSLFALQETKSVTLHGAKYPLVDESLRMGSRGLHNVADSGHLSLSFTSGRLMLLVPRSMTRQEERT